MQGTKCRMDIQCVENIRLSGMSVLVTVVFLVLLQLNGGLLC